MKPRSAGLLYYKGLLKHPHSHLTDVRNGVPLGLL
jgi:hypothetical protein